MRINSNYSFFFCFFYKLKRFHSHNNIYKTRMWDIGGDEWNLFNGASILEVASLSLDEPAT